MVLKLDFKMHSFLINNIFFLKWNYNSLICVFLMEILTNNLLMSAWINFESFIKSICFFKVFYYSRSKFFLWFKGNSSGNFQFLKNIYIDCDMDCLIFNIFQLNNSPCHTGNKKCFYNFFNINRF